MQGKQIQKDYKLLESCLGIPESIYVKQDNFGVR